jgi:hypothetical protein
MDFNIILSRPQGVFYFTAYSFCDPRLTKKKMHLFKNKFVLGLFRNTQPNSLYEYTGMLLKMTAFKNFIFIIFPTSYLKITDFQY